MISKKPVFVLLLSLAVLFAHSAVAEDLPELENYKPPQGLFDIEEAPAEPAPSPFLTTIEPAKKTEPKAKPKPPKKPATPVKTVKKKTSASPVKKTGVKKPVVAAVPVEPVTKAPLQIETERLVHPTARDVLENIEGIKSTESTGKGKFSLLFMPGETVLTFDMKNKLLSNYVPSVKKQPKQKLAVQAYASPGKDGETGARRLSLARALEVRDFLVGAGIEESRINVMPLGNQTESQLSDRVDIVPLKSAD